MSRRWSAWGALTAVSISVFVAALDLTVTTAVLPQLIFDFDIPLPDGLADAAWIVNGYLIAYVVAMPLMGRVSDLYGRRLTFLVALGLFVLGSLWAATTNSLWPMVAARVIQALGGGAMVPVAFAAVSDAVAVENRPLAIGAVAAADTVGWVAGPVYGAWLTAWLGWRWIFWLNVPLGLAAAFLVWFSLPNRRQAGRTLDLIGAFLLTLFLLAFTLGLYQSAPASPELGALAVETQPQVSPWLWPIMAVALLALAGFVIWERRVDEPLIDIRLLTSRVFSGSSTVNLLTGIILMAVMVEVPVLLTAVSETLTAATASSARLLALFAAGMVIGAVVAGPMLRVISPRLVTVVGLLLMIGGLWLVAGWEQTAPITALSWPLALAGFGLGIVTTPLATAVLDYVASAERGIAASLLLVARLLGMTLGLALLVTWALRRYYALVAEVPPPPGGLLDPNAADYLAEAVAGVTTTVVTDLFFLTAIIGIVTLVPALLLPSGRPPATAE